MTPLPQLESANASFVTDRLLVGGDLDARSDTLAGRQLDELVAAGVTHIVDVRVEWSDEETVRRRAPEVGYLHAGIDDAGQLVPPAWFDEVVGYAVEALDSGGTVLAHCHMGINRGPSLGFAVLLARGWDAVEALDAIRRARPIAYIAYAEDALRWHHGDDVAALRDDLRRLAHWRDDNELDLETVIRLTRQQS